MTPEQLERIARATYEIETISFRKHRREFDAQVAAGREPPEPIRFVVENEAKRYARKWEQLCEIERDARRSVVRDHFDALSLAGFSVYDEEENENVRVAIKITPVGAADADGEKS